MTKKTKGATRRPKPIRYFEGQNYADLVCLKLSERIIEPVGNDENDHGLKVYLTANSGEGWGNKSDDWLSVHIETVGGETADVDFRLIDALIDALVEMRADGEGMVPI